MRTLKKLSDRQSALLDFVTKKHGDQERKYSGEPYWFHLLSVANIVTDYLPDSLAVEIALCHDLFEDTDCSSAELKEVLESIGYDWAQVSEIHERVVDLTDVYTKENCPDSNRRERKALESDRLGKIHPISQTVKYADLIDNMNSIAEHDKNFAIIYLKEKRAILNVMRAGHPQLLTECEKLYEFMVRAIS